MSLEKKSTHVRIAPDMHERLRIIGALAGNDMAEHAALLLEKAIMGEWHLVSMQLDRAVKCGLVGNDRDYLTELLAGQQKTPHA